MGRTDAASGLPHFTRSTTTPGARVGAIRRLRLWTTFGATCARSTPRSSAKSADGVRILTELSGQPAQDGDALGNRRSGVPHRGRPLLERLDWVDDVEVLGGAVGDLQHLGVIGDRAQ